jgi:thiosulfate/3-mercaptopyruvate sulfurtransferase
MILRAYNLSIVLLFWTVASSNAFSHPTLTGTFIGAFASSNSLISMKSNLLSIPECIELHSDAVFVDGSWHLSSRDGRTEYEAGPRIKGAHFLDIDDVGTKCEKNLPHMLPSKEVFAKVMDSFGITSATNIVVYGSEGCFSIPRAFYTFRSMGHDKVHIMDGTLTDWIDSDGPTETGAKESFKLGNLAIDGAAKYKESVDPKNIVDIDYVFNVVNKGKTSGSIIVDARSNGRFIGIEPEPRPGLRGGHMPGAFNVPFNTLLDDVNKKFRPIEEMKSIFQHAGVDIDTENNIVCSCGSGVTACWLALALEECGRDPSKTLIYDGSWIEWASDENTPVVT